MAFRFLLLENNSFDIDVIQTKLKDGGITYFSQGFEKIFDCLLTELTANPSGWLDRIHLDDREHVAERFAQALTTDGFDIQYRVVLPENRLVWVRDRCFFVRDETGQVIHITGIIEDISESKYRERNAEFLTKIAQDLTRSISINEIFESIGGEMCRYFNFSILTFSEINDTTNQARVIYNNRNPGIKDALGEHHLTDYLSDTQIAQLKEGEVVAINDVSALDIEGGDAAYQPFQVRSTLIAPCLSNEQLKFIFAGNRNTISCWRKDEIELVQELAARIWIRIERARAEENLRRSEEEFRNIANATPALVWVGSPNGENTFFNDRWYEFTGQTEAEAVGLGWAETMHPDDASRILPYWKHCQKTGETYEGEVRYRRHDGEYLWHAFRALPRRNANGQIEAWYGISIDISERKQVEAALQESERRFRRLVESNLFGVAFGDFTGNISYANDYFLKMVGYTREELGMGQVRWTDMTPVEFLPVDEKAVFELRTKGVATPFEKEYLRKDGTRVPILIGAARLQEPDDEQQEVIGFYLDLTERKQAQAAIAQSLAAEQASRAEAETANRIKDEFLAVLSHELRSPLNPILGWAKLLQSRTFPSEKIAEALATIERNAKLQAQLIEDLLDVSRILRGKMVLNVSQVNLVTIIEAAIETVRLTADTKSIQIQTSLNDHVKTIFGDSTRLQQIIWNLLTNAIKFTPQGGKVEVRLDRVENFAQIQVQDTGKGISSEFLPYVFDYFRQEDGATTRKFGGLGLGLAIVRHLTEQHGGTIKVESQGEGLGTTFTIRLPLPTVISEKVQQHSSACETVDLSQLKILVVDDEADMRALLLTILEAHGAQVRVAVSATEALRILEQNQIDVLISDIGMPEIDGYMLMQQVRSLPPQQGGQIRAIALTAYAGEFDRQQALSVGFQKHLPKPVEPQTLIQAIASLINSS